MTSKDPLVRTAVRLLRASEQRQTRSNRQYEGALEMVQYHAKLLAQYLGASHKAHGHGWIAAVDQMQTRVSETLRQLQSATSEAVIHSQRPPILRPTLRDLHQDLLQLHQEFEEVTLDLKGGIVIAVTDAIQLEDVYLGPFRLELHLDRLAERAEVSVFDVVALDPHPPASSEDVTHPHVRDNQLCAGEATAPIAHALREGRICDAFLAVNSVLHTYNVHSPFVSLSDWEGVPCADCGYATSEDQRYYCEDCGQDFCEECYSTCDICQTSCCRGCLEKDQESDQLCCKGCRRYCGRCNRMVDADSFDGETELCPGCHEQLLQEQEEESKPIEENQNEQQDTNSSPEKSLVPDPA
jgi:hypothetical protein